MIIQQKIVCATYDSIFLKQKFIIFGKKNLSFQNKQQKKMDFKKKSTTTTNKNPSSQITKKGYQPLKFKSDHTQGINPEQFYLENFCKSYTVKYICI